MQGPVTRARDFDHFKKFARKGKFFQMLSWGGLGGFRPPGNLRYPCLAPRISRNDVHRVPNTWGSTALTFQWDFASPNFAEIAGDILKKLVQKFVKKFVQKLRARKDLLLRPTFAQTFTQTFAQTFVNFVRTNKFANPASWGTVLEPSAPSKMAPRAHFFTPP